MTRHDAGRQDIPDHAQEALAGCVHVVPLGTRMRRDFCSTVGASMDGWRAFVQN